MIKWVITIPAIWNDKAKQFMREAAFEVSLLLDFLEFVTILICLPYTMFIW